MFREKSSTPDLWQGRYVSWQRKDCHRTDFLTEATREYPSDCEALGPQHSGLVHWQCSSISFKEGN